MEEDRRFPGWLFPVAGVVGVVALVAIGLAREPAELDPESPEGTVQLYIEALVDGDFDTAVTYLADDGCIPTSIIPTGGAPDVSAALVNVDGNDTAATVTVRLIGTSADPVSGTYEYQEWFSLIKQDDRWRIRQPTWPYYDLPCEESA
jgi:hypothetical protein